MSDAPPPDWLQSVVGMKLFDVIFGAAGGAVRGIVVRNLSWSQRISSTVVGALTAGSFGPVASALATRWIDYWGFNLTQVDLGGSVVFVVGLCGMTFCDVLIRWAKKYRDDPPGPLLPPRK